MANHQIDSLIKFINSQDTEATGTLIQITRNSVVMEVYNPYSIVQLSEVLNNLSIRREDRIIYQGRAVVSTLVNTGLYLIVSATLVDPWQDLSGLEQNSVGTKDEAERFLQDWEKSNEITPSFQLTVTEIRSLLLELNRWLEQVDLFAENDGVTHSPESSAKLFNELRTSFGHILQQKFQTFENEAKKVQTDDINNHRKFAQRDLHPLLLRSPFVWRTFYKPLGYAGDYEMVNMMLRSPDEGPTSYSKLMNIMFLSAGPAAAHRNRIEILCDSLTAESNKAKSEKRPLKVLNIGCGPAIEIQQLLKNKVLDGNSDLTLMDFSEETLSYTRQQIEKALDGSDAKVTFIHKSVHTLLKESARSVSDSFLETYDVVYCAGLFDYLSDKVCSRLLRLFHNQTKPEGLTLVTNVHPNNPVKNIMEFLLEWHLIYRNEEDMSSLFTSSEDKKVYLDKSKVNVFMEIRK